MKRGCGYILLALISGLLPYGFCPVASLYSDECLAPKSQIANLEELVLLDTAETTARSVMHHAGNIYQIIFLCLGNLQWDETPKEVEASCDKAIETVERLAKIFDVLSLIRNPREKRPQFADGGGFTYFEVEKEEDLKKLLKSPPRVTRLIEKEILAIRAVAGVFKSRIQDILTTRTTLWELQKMPGISWEEKKVKLAKILEKIKQDLEKFREEANAAAHNWEIHFFADAPLLYHAPLSEGAKPVSISLRSYVHTEPNFWLGGTTSSIYRDLSIAAELTLREGEDYKEKLLRFKAQKGLQNRDVILAYLPKESDTYNRVRLVVASLEKLLEATNRDWLNDTFAYKQFKAANLASPMCFESTVDIDDVHRSIFAQSMYFDESLQGNGLGFRYLEIQKCIREECFPGYAINTIAGNIITAKTFADFYNADLVSPDDLKIKISSGTIHLLLNLGLLDNRDVDYLSKMSQQIENDIPYSLLYEILKENWQARGQGNILKGILCHLDSQAKTMRWKAINDILFRSNVLWLRGVVRSGNSYQPREFLPDTSKGPCEMSALAPQSEFLTLQREREQLENTDLSTLDGESLIRWYARLAYLTHAMTGKSRGDILNEISKKIMQAVLAGKISASIYDSYFFAFNPGFSLSGPAILIPQLPSPFENADGRFVRFEGDSESDLWHLISMIKDKTTLRRPALIGITGGPGSGKSHMTRTLEHLSRSKGGKSRLIALDDYMLAKRIREIRGIHRGLEKYDRQRLTRDAQSIRRREAFNLPRYDPEKGHAVDDWEHPVNPSALDQVFIEGECALLHKELQDQWHVRVYVDQIDFLRYVRECMRDLRTRGRDPMDTTWIFITSQVPDYMDLVRGQIRQADIVYRPTEKEIWVRKEHQPVIAPAAEKQILRHGPASFMAEMVLSGAVEPHFWLGGKDTRLYQALNIQSEISVHTADDLADAVKEFATQKAVSAQNVVLLAYYKNKGTSKRIHLVAAKLGDLLHPDFLKALESDQFVHQDSFESNMRTPLLFECSFAVEPASRLFEAEGLYIDKDLRKSSQGLAREYHAVQKAIRETNFPRFDIRTVAGNLNTIHAYLDNYDADFHFGRGSGEVMDLEDLAFLSQLELLDAEGLAQINTVVQEMGIPLPYATLYLMLKDKWAIQGSKRTLQGVVDHLEKIARVQGRDAVNEALFRFSGLEIQGKIGKQDVITKMPDVEAVTRFEDAA